MEFIILLSVCICSVLSQVSQFQPGIFQPILPVSGSQTGFQTRNVLNAGATGFNTGTGTFESQSGIFQDPFTGFVGPAGFDSPFGPLAPGGISLGVSGIPAGGSVFGPAGSFSPMSPPLSPVTMMMASLSQNPNNYRHATCTFNDTWSTVKGRADFRQFVLAEGNQQVQVRIQLTGLPQAMTEAERGLHVHEFGDIGDGCSRVGPHFNPDQTPHGSQRQFSFLRHVGDLGNIRQTRDGLVSTQFVDQVISLEGQNNILGRTLVLKLERDDEGLGGTRDSGVNGNTHNPIACCVIGRTSARNWYNPMSTFDIQNMAATGMMPESSVNAFSTNLGFNQGMTQFGLSQPTGISQQTGLNTLGTSLNGQQLFGAQQGFNGQTSFSGQPGFGGQLVFSGQPGFTGQSSFIGQPAIGLAQGGFSGSSSSGFNQGGLSMIQPGTFGIGTGAFTPGATSGQTFNFNANGKRKK